MAEAGIDEATARKHPGGIGRVATRIIGALAVIVGIATVQFLLVLFLTFVSWKAAVGAEVVAMGVAILIWKRQESPAWLRYVIVATLVLATVSLALFARTTWASQAEHDARLAAMVTELCGVDLSVGRIEDCGGSIANTGNGNSCRFLATAIVTGLTDRSAGLSQLQEQGFEGTGLDLWDDPVEDGRTYFFDAHQRLHIFLQSSWQDDEGDLRGQ